MKRILFICFLAILTTCSKDMLEKRFPSQPDKVIMVDIPEIRFNGSYMEFSTSKAFDATLSSITNASAANVLKWNQHYGFVSIRSIYEQVANEQQQYLSKLVAQYEAFDPKDPRLQQEPVIERQPLAEKYTGLLKFDNNGLIVGLREFHFDMAGLLNKDRVVKVAGNILQYNESNIKIIEGGDSAKISLLEGITETDKGLNIIVIPVERKSKSSSGSRMAYSHQATCDIMNYLTRYITSTSLNISFYSTPIYGPEVCENCSPVPGAKLVPTCYCYNPIIGYNFRTVYTCHMDVTARLFGISAAHRPIWSFIKVDWNVNGAPMPSQWARSADLSNTDLTVYDGPAVNVTSAYHSYTWDWASICSCAAPYGTGCSDSFSD
jgi:hypothetical protein